MHTCHAYECNAPVKPEMFMCLRHWCSLSPQLRSLIWRAYRPGQCDDWKISTRYAALAKNAIRFIADNEKKVIPENATEIGLYDRLSGDGTNRWDSGGTPAPGHQERISWPELESANR